MLRYLSFFFFCFISGSAPAQSFSFRQYQVENGLSNSAVTSIVQDEKGFMWIGTSDGLNRFDGYSFKVFRNTDPAIGNNNIRALYADHNRIWLGTEKGLFCFNTETERFKFIPGVSSKLVSALQMDKEGMLWLLSDYTLNKLNPKTGKIVQSFPGKQYFKASTFCFAGNQLWVSTANGLLQRYDQKTSTFKAFDVFRGKLAADNNRWIDQLYPTNDGNLLIGTATHGAKLFSVKDRSFKNILTTSDEGTTLFIKTFLQINQDEYWIGTESSGVYRYNTKTSAISQITKRYHDPYALSDNSINTFFRDKQGGIWIGTNYGGLNYYAGDDTFRKFYPVQSENSLNGNIITAIQQDSKGNLWIGTEDKGLNKMEQATGKFYHFAPGSSKQNLAYNHIYSLLIDGKDLWIGTYVHGLDVMDVNTGRIIRHYGIAQDSNSLRNDIINAIYRSLNGKIYVATAWGVYFYNRDKGNFTLLKQLPLTWYTCLFQEKDGTLWAGSVRSGVFTINTITGATSGYRYNFRDPGSIGKGKINSIFGDSKGRTWLATEGGLCLFNKRTKNFSRYTELNGLPSNIIMGIQEDEKQNLWLSTSHGLVRFNPENGKCKVYKQGNGLLNDQFNYNSSFKDRDGKMYFGGLKGLISFNPESLQSKPINAPLYITGFQVNNKELPIGKQQSPLKKSLTSTDELTLKYDQASFSIDFAALNYTAPGSTLYAYKMEGLDKDWTYLESNRKVYFTNLSPGIYKFRVKAFTDDDRQIFSERTLTIKVQPPWWLSVWAYIFYLAGGISIVILFVKSYRKKIEQRSKRKLEQLEIARAKEMYEDKLSFFTNIAHEIKTPLTLIKGPLESLLKTAEDPDVADSLRTVDRNATRLVELTNQFLDFRQTEIEGYSLHFVNENISEMVQECYEAFKRQATSKGLEYKLLLPEEPVFAPVDTDAFNKILSNLFSNALKYADRQVVAELISAENTPGLLTFNISNDGFIIPGKMAERIFEPFVRLEETRKRGGFGIGLALSLSLVRLHKGSLQLVKLHEGMNTFSLQVPVNHNGK